MSFEVQGKTALVTGSNRGIGRAIVESLLANGVSKVYTAVRDLSKADDLVTAHPGRVEAIEIDLARPETISAAAAEAADVNLVINNAGILKMANPLSEGAVEALQSEIEINVFGLLRMAQAFAPVLESNGGGAFVQLNSVASIKNFADLSTYSASKAATYSITQGLRDYLGKQGTVTLSVHPGAMATDMAHSTGMGDIAEPASLVGDGIVAALAKGDFHLFPGNMASGLWGAYEGFARGVIEVDLMAEM